MYDDERSPIIWLVSTLPSFGWPVHCHYRQPSRPRAMIRGNSSTLARTSSSDTDLQPVDWPVHSPSTLISSTNTIRQYASSIGNQIFRCRIHGTNTFLFERSSLNDASILPRHKEGSNILPWLQPTTDLHPVDRPVRCERLQYPTTLR